MNKKLEFKGLHDDRCLIRKGLWCNCPSAAFLRDGESCGRIAGKNEA